MNFLRNEIEIISALAWIAKQTTYSGVLFHLLFNASLSGAEPATSATEDYSGSTLDTKSRKRPPSLDGLETMG